jgi:cytochrome c-type biogenesis protein
VTFDLLAVFGAGLLSFVTPCVLPVIPIYLAALVGGDLKSLEGGRYRLLRRALLFSLGFVAVFTLMGLGASSFGAFLSEQRVAVQLTGALLVLAFALKFLGVVRIPALDRVVKADDRKVLTRFAGVNALLMGVVFAAGWSPCVGPVLGSVLTFTASTATHPVAGAGYLAAYGLGFALPLLVTAAFAEAGTRMLRRLGPQLPRIEKGMGLLMLAVAAFLAHGAVRGMGGPAADPAGHGTGSVEVPADPAEADGEALPRMVEVYTADCPICRRMKPLMAELVAQCDRRGVRVETVDVSGPENRHLAARHRVVGVPTFLFIDEDGQEVARLVGEQTEGALKQGLAALRGEECPGLGRLPEGPATLLDGNHDDRPRDLAFPVQQEEDSIACPSTSTDAKPVPAGSRSSAGSETPSPFAAPSAGSPPESCSPASPSAARAAPARSPRADTGAAGAAGEGCEIPPV